jgi:hypothetical protein
MYCIVHAQGVSPENGEEEKREGDGVDYRVLSDGQIRPVPIGASKTKVTRTLAKTNNSNAIVRPGEANNGQNNVDQQIVHYPSQRRQLEVDSHKAQIEQFGVYRQVMRSSDYLIEKEKHEDKPIDIQSLLSSYSVPTLVINCNSFNQRDALNKYLDIGKMAYGVESDADVISKLLNESSKISYKPEEVPTEDDLQGSVVWEWKHNDVGIRDDMDCLSS